LVSRKVNILIAQPIFVHTLFGSPGWRGCGFRYAVIPPGPYIRDPEGEGRALLPKILQVEGRVPFQVIRGLEGEKGSVPD